MSETAIPPAAAEPNGAAPPRRGGRAARKLVWAALCVAFAAFVLLSRVDTYLGVEAPSWDKQGRDQVWRVWWRARHRMIDFGPSWGFSLLLAALVGLFLAGSVWALWIALVADDPAPPVPLDIAPADQT